MCAQVKVCDSTEATSASTARLFLAAAATLCAVWVRRTARRAVVGAVRLARVLLVYHWPVEAGGAGD